MPSLQFHFQLLLLKLFFFPRFRKAGNDIPRLREALDSALKFQRVPPGTAVESVSAGGVEAEWVIPPGVAGPRVFVHLHGGGGCLGSARTHREQCARLGLAAGCRGLCLDYRLGPEHPFPAGLEDVLAAYRWLLDTGHAPESIALGGDSAGGGLTVQALLTLREAGDPLPGAAYLLSPMLDWVRFDGESLRSRASRDVWIDPGGLPFMASSYLGQADPTDPRLYPFDADLRGLPPFLIQVGDAEVLLSDSIRLARSLRSADVPVGLQVFPHMPHVFQALARSVPEAQRAVDDLGWFLRHSLA